MMDAPITRAVEDFVGAGYPREAEAVLLVEIDGLPAGVAEQTAAVEAIARANGATTVRVAADEAERALLWKGRKSAFGAIARIAPDYYLHDAVVPRTRLVDVLGDIARIASAHELLVMNVFHAGDGNLHPLIVFDGRQDGHLGPRPGRRDGDPRGVPRRRWRAHRRARRRHREARTDAEALHPRRPRRAGEAARRVRSRRRGEPDEGAAARQPVRRAAARPGGDVDLTDLQDAVARADAVVALGSRTQAEVGDPVVAGAVEVGAPSGVVRYEPADMTITVGAGTSFAELREVLADAGQECPLDPRDERATVGGAASPAACRACAACATARCATTCSRCGWCSATGAWSPAGGRP
ncbi:MAG: hypothetical protein KatS3mg010_0383 [Acidimicrobiia bacterium]|nr:MAG: hypothetical protein KatS3mg010_0383 [Acidimicrobiia bacterium]